MEGRKPLPRIPLFHYTAPVTPEEVQYYRALDQKFAHCNLPQDMALDASGRSPAKKASPDYAKAAALYKEHSASGLLFGEMRTTNMPLALQPYKRVSPVSHVSPERPKTAGSLPNRQHSHRQAEPPSYSRTIQPVRRPSSPPIRPRSPPPDLGFAEIDRRLTEVYRKVHAKGLPFTKSRDPKKPYLLDTRGRLDRIWAEKDIRDRLVSLLPLSTRKAMRCVCPLWRDYFGLQWFENLVITLNGNTWKASRLDGLRRMGRFVRSVTFKIPHSANTALPSLVDPTTSQKVHWDYDPYLSVDKGVSRYGSDYIHQLLIDQYPSIFHTATNVAGFVEAFTCMSQRLDLLKIECPVNGWAQPYRKGIVDYALMSIRVAVETVQNPRLTELSLSPIHHTGLAYLHPIADRGAGAWTRLTSFNLTIDDRRPQLHSHPEYLKLLHSYLDRIAPNLRHLTIGWGSGNGPCPLTLEQDSILQVHNALTEDPVAKRLKPLYFPQLTCASIGYAMIEADSMSSFVGRHHATLRRVELVHCKVQNGTWDSALSPLKQDGRSDVWRMLKEDNLPQESTVPLMLDTRPALLSGAVHPALRTNFDNTSEHDQNQSLLRKIKRTSKQVLSKMKTGLLHPFDGARRFNSLHPAFRRQVRFAEDARAPKTPYI